MTNRNYKNLLAIFGLIAACIVFYFVFLRWDVLFGALKVGAKILTPISYGVVMAYLLNPVMRFVQLPVTNWLKKVLPNPDKAVGIGKVIAIATAILFGLAVVTVVILMIVPELIRSLEGLFSNLPGQMAAVWAALEKFVMESPIWQEEILGNLQADVGTIMNNLFQKFLDMLSNVGENGLLSMTGDLVGYVTAGVVGAVKFVFNMFIGVMVAVYALASKEDFIAQSKKLLFACFKPGIANNILDVARHAHTIFGGFLIGKIIDSIIIGILCYISMLILKMPYPLLIGVFVGITNVVPIFGPFIGAIPSAILIILVDPFKAIIFAIFILVLQQIDGNIIGPTILGDTTGLPEFWVVLALILCGGLWGIVGMVIGVPLVATIYYVIKRLMERLLRKKNFPTTTEAYRDVDYYDVDSQSFRMDVEASLKRKKAQKKAEKKQKKKPEEEAGQ